MNPEFDEPASTNKSLNFTANFGVSRVWSILLGLQEAEVYCKTLPVSLGLAACVDQIALDRGLNIEHIKAAAKDIPQNGAILVTANHPTGILDGVVLLCALLSRRNDVWIVANDLTSQIPVLADCIIPIKKTDKGDGHSVRALLQVRRAWRRNQCVVVFPAGTVAHWQLKGRVIKEAPWTTSFQTLAVALKIPEFRATLTIKNPFWFHVCAAVSRKSRLVFLLRAFFSGTANHPSYPVSFTSSGPQP